MNTIKYTIFLVLIVAVCGISYGFTNSVYSGTYVDASAANTERVGGGTWYSADAATALANNWWRLRSGYANPAGGGGTIYEADGTNGWVNAPVIKTSVPSLYPYMYYDAYVVYWSSGSTWCVWAGLSSDSLTLYGKADDSPTGAVGGTATGAVEGDRSEYEAYLGVGIADASGKLGIYIDDSTVNDQGSRTWYDGVEYKLINVPFNPSPADGAVSIPVETGVLSFTAMRDPNNLTVENPKIVSHKVYFNNDPNLTGADGLIATLAYGVGEATIPSEKALQYDNEYYWRVDEVLNDGTVITGRVWTFESAKTTPDFDPPIGSQPQDTAVMLGDDAVLTVSAGVGTYTYQWYKGSSGDTINPVDDEEGHISGAATSQLTITTLAGDEGTYWCRAVNSESADSAAATVLVKRNVAHWTLNNDTAGWDGANYLDTGGEGHHAAVTGTPAFSEGIIDGAVTITATEGYASAGTWNPSQYSGQFTVSMWAKWGGQTEPTTWQGLISKETSYGDGTMMWQLEMTSASASTLVLKNGLETNNLSSDVLPVGVWEHIAVTFDGTTATIYRNGAAAASSAWSMGTQTDAPIHIGITAVSTTENLMFNGDLDDIQIFNYALDPYAVADIYTTVKPEDQVCIENPEMDFSGPEGTPDCKVNLYDFAIIADKWMECNLVPSSACFQ